MTAPTQSPRVLIYDIETAPIIGAAWRKYDADLIWIEQDWRLLSFAYKWLGQQTVRSLALPDFDGYAKDPTNDRALSCALWQLFDQADVVVAHNGDKFDQRKARAKFFEHGFMPPTPFAEVDTLKIAKRHFAFTSNRLDDLCRLRGIGGKLSTGGAGLWRACLDGDPAAWRKMKRYNRHDVVLLEALYRDLLPFTDGRQHPNMALLADKPDACTKCGQDSVPLKSTGWRHNNATSRRRFRCPCCAGFSYGRSLVKSHPTQHVS